MIVIRNIKVFFSDNPGVKGLYLIFTTNNKRITTKNYLAHFKLPLPVKSGGVWYSELVESEIERIPPLDLPDSSYARLETYPHKNKQATIQITYL